MCGIASIYSYHQTAQPVDQGELLRIREAMEKRGPDGAGLWLATSGHVGLAHRRLSIIDLSDAGAQPMATSDGQLHIVFNGEIYNYRELRERLQAKGHRFRSDSDTEVLLFAWREYGQDMVEHLRGMFAFAIWEEERKGLFLARDHFGIKPLYYHDDGKTFRAASQVKALLAGGGIEARSEAAGHVGFYLWGCVPEPYTLYRNVYSLPAGHTLWVDECGPRVPRRYFDITQELERAASARIDRPVAETLKEALRDSVRHHLIADVPVGLFLSSGLDSATLTALATEERNTPVQAITLGFKEFKNTPSDEVPLARKLAAHYGCDHHVGRITKQDFDEDISAILHAMDQPSIDGVNTWFVAREAKRAGLKVALSGLGGDELLGGYPSFHQIPKLIPRVRPFAAIPGIGKALRFVSAPILKHNSSPKYASLLEYGGTYGGAYLLRRGLFMPWELPKHMDGEIVREGWAKLQPILRLDEWTARVQSPHAKVVSMEMAYYMRNMLLRDSDWAGMAHSLEIRVPLIDITLFRALAPHLVGNKPPLKRDLHSVPQRSLPDEIVNRPKTGFSIPVRDWIGGQILGNGTRGLRGWALHVTGQPDFKAGASDRRRNILAFLPDGYGGRGGIAKFNRDLLWSICSSQDVNQVLALPRYMPDRHEGWPLNLDWDTRGLGGKWAYIRAASKAMFGNFGADLVLCGHINLLPIAWIAARIKHAPLWCVIHGVDAWEPNKSALVNHLIHKVDGFIAVSELTRERFRAWAGVSEETIQILPNCYDPALFYPAQRNETLVDRYRLRGKKVLLTVGRLVSKERYKGFDEVIQILPELAREIPDIAYLVVGAGDDRARLEDKTCAMGIADKVIFAGYVDEMYKTDHYRLADVYVMPSRGEGFGIVFLEAMACGVPAIGSKLDGSREALLDGILGTLVDPGKPKEIIEAIRTSLQKGHYVPEKLSELSLYRFKEKVVEILNEAI